jgi:hypothetical protein
MTTEVGGGAPALTRDQMREVDRAVMEDLQFVVGWLWAGGLSAGRSAMSPNFGSERFFGSMGRAFERTNRGHRAHPSGNGYWLIASDGGVPL